jgi:HAE1 family hydrophobic/amphiphilic exporter-1
VTQSDFRTNFGASGFSPFAGGSYTADFLLPERRRTTKTLAQSAVSGALNLTYTQPLWRGLTVDNNRRNIEIAKKNLSLTDAQFRGRAIEVIAQSNKRIGIWYSRCVICRCRIDAVKQARTQLESNQRTGRQRRSRAD